MIRIRKMEIKDLEFFLSIRNECKEFLHNPIEYTLEQSLKWFVKDNPKFYIIINEEINIGYFRTSNWKKDSLYIGADIHKDYRGKGYAKEAYPLFMDYLNCVYATFK